MEFWDTEPAKPEFNYDNEKKKFIDNMDYLQSMTVEEQTLYKKWDEWNSDLSNSMKRKAAMAQYIDQLWAPADIMNKEQTIKEIEELDPYVEVAICNEISVKRAKAQVRTFVCPTSAFLARRVTLSDVTFESVGRGTILKIRHGTTPKICSISS